MRFSLPSALALVLFAAGCSRLTAPVDDAVTALPEHTAVSALPATPPPPAPTPAPPPPAPTPPPEPSVRAAHVLISYKGAKMADAKITRTKDDAKKLAVEIAKKAKKEDFAALAKKFSDDKGSAANGGDLGEFTRPRMVKPFSDAAFALKPGEVSAVVESDFGFHVIKRAP